LKKRHENFKNKHREFCNRCNDLRRNEFSNRWRRTYGYDYSSQVVNRIPEAVYKLIQQIEIILRYYSRETIQSRKRPGCSKKGNNYRWHTMYAGPDDIHSVMRGSRPLLFDGGVERSGPGNWEGTISEHP